MNMPGFTAENALYNTHRKYNIPNPAGRRSSSGLGVAPQAFARTGAGAGIGITIEPEQCQIRCRWVCGRYGCYPTDCYEVCF